MFALKCLRCSNLRIPSRDDLIFRRFSPSSFARSLVNAPNDVDRRARKWQPMKRELLQEHQQGDLHFEPFYNMITRRRDEALRSVLLGFDKNTESQVMPFLESLEGIKCKYFYGLHDMQKKYVLVEFSTVQEANRVLAEAGLEDDKFSQAEGRVLIMKGANGKLPKEKLSVEWNKLEPNTNFLTSEMKSCKNMDEIMEIYLRAMQVCDLSSRLHFITCIQIERIFLGAYPKVRAIPFGSSVNGFGRKGSDLDICLLLNHRQAFSRNGLKQNQGPVVVRPVQFEKSSKEMINLYGTMMQVMLPSCSNIFTLPNARVPIIKFKDSDTNCDCDMNVSGALGICMSEMLYTFSCWDERCRTVLFTVRAWARHQGVTSPFSPSTKITNFSLVLLVVFFLQTRDVLPTIHEMEELADDSDIIVYQGKPHLFLRTVTREKIELWKRKRGKSNGEPASRLLKDFFGYFKHFSFDSKALTISNATTLNNPTRDPMYIVNPLEPTLNVARNVRGKDLELFKQKCEYAWCALSSSDFHKPLEMWALLFAEDALKKKNKQNLIAELFQNDQETVRRKTK